MRLRAGSTSGENNHEERRLRLKPPEETLLQPRQGGDRANIASSETSLMMEMDVDTGGAKETPLTTTPPKPPENQILYKRNVGDEPEWAASRPGLTAAKKKTQKAGKEGSEQNVGKTLPNSVLS